MLGLFILKGFYKFYRTKLNIKTIPGVYNEKASLWLLEEKEQIKLKCMTVQRISLTVSTRGCQFDTIVAHIFHDKVVRAIVYAP